LADFVGAYQIQRSRLIEPNRGGVENLIAEHHVVDVTLLATIEILHVFRRVMRFENASQLPQMPDAVKLSEVMLKQSLSWPSKVHVDEVAAILFEGAYRIMEAEYGIRRMAKPMDRAAEVAAARLSDGGGGPTHRMELAA
jgi:hypothetical protein